MPAPTGLRAILQKAPDCSTAASTFQKRFPSLEPRLPFPLGSRKQEVPVSAEAGNEAVVPQGGLRREVSEAAGALRSAALDQEAAEAVLRMQTPDRPRRSS